MRDLQTFEFTGKERCDRCHVAQAYMIAEHPNGGELWFCLHDGRLHYQTLLDKGWRIAQDEQAIEDITPEFYKIPVTA